MLPELKVILRIKEHKYLEIRFFVQSTFTAFAVEPLYR